MNKQIKPFLYVLIVIVVMAFSACGQADDSAVEATETPTPAVDQAGGGTGSTDEDQQGGGTGGTSVVGDQSDDESAGSAESTQEPTLPPSPADSCLIGTWRSDREAFREYMIQSMNVSDAAQFEFGEIEGDLEMVITQDDLSFRTANPLRIPLTMTASGVELLSLHMVIEGSGDANWLTYEDLFIMYGSDYNFFGDGLANVISTELVGQAETRVNMTPDLWVSMATFTNIDISHVEEIHPELENYAVATYTCEGDVFTYQFGDYQAVWLRQ